MLEMDNQTAWAGGVYPGWNRNGQYQFTAVIKAGFTYDEQGRLSEMEDPPEIEMADRYSGESGTSSLAAACEIVPFKDGAEILLRGTAVPPTRNARVMEVSLGMRLQGDRFWEKKLRIFGPRRWVKGLLGASPGNPEMLNPVPLTYENAYGGADPNHPEKVYAANPAGRGYSEKGWRTRALELPLIETGSPFISHPTQRVSPAGFGPISPLWTPRIQAFAGKSKDSLSQNGCPFGKQAPPGYYNVAPSDQRFDNPFSGGETLRLKGFISSGKNGEGLLMHLPVIHPELHLVIGDRFEPLHAVCDTLLIDTDARQICLLWRAAIPWDIKETRSGWVILRDPEAEEKQTPGAVEANL